MRGDDQQQSGVFSYISAKNPVHNRRGRVIYPDHQGCIGQAWQNGKHIATGLPDPTNDWRSYRALQISQYGLSGDVVDALTMRSRSYIAFALDGPSSERRIAVLVIESMAAVSEAKIRQFEQVVGGVEGTRLAKFLEIWERNGPNLDYAKGEGF
jgi:hypothetical protein